MHRNLSFLANFRTAIDILKNRMPGALAMLKAKDIAISTHSNDKGEQWNTITFYFDHDAEAKGNAYRACERLYEFNRSQERLPWRS
jgi:hypothetical protein